MVAPHVGAWIEIRVLYGGWQDLIVAPHVGAWIEIDRRNGYKYPQYVAPHVGAWIEIRGTGQNRSCWESHPTWVRGLKYSRHVRWRKGMSRTPRGCVDWNLPPSMALVLSGRRTPRGCVDWNSAISKNNLNFRDVAPHVGAWIEMLINNSTRQTLTGRTPRGCVDWNSATLRTELNYHWSHPTWVRGLKCSGAL